MKVMLLTRKLDRGGAQTQLVVLARGLKQKGYDVVVAAFYGGGPLEDELQKAGVRIVSLEKSGRWDLFGFAFRCLRLVRKERPTILYSFLSVPNIISALLSPFVSTMRVVWGIRASNMDLSKYDLLCRLSYRVERILSQAADVIICNSEAGMRYAISNGFPKQKMICIPNGIDTEKFRPDREARMRIRHELGVQDCEILVGMVARCDPMKDHVTYLRAIALASKEVPELRGICVGGGKDKYRQDARALAALLELDGRVIWVDERHDTHAIYNAFDISCLASVSEGFSNVIGEAMSCGVPCAVTDVGDSAVIVGDCGYVVPPRNPNALFDAILKMLSLHASQRREMGARARARIVSEFSLHKMVERSAKILKDIS